MNLNCKNKRFGAGFIGWPIIDSYGLKNQKGPCDFNIWILFFIYKERAMKILKM